MSEQIVLDEHDLVESSVHLISRFSFWRRIIRAFGRLNILFGVCKQRIYKERIDFLEKMSVQQLIHYS